MSDGYHPRGRDVSDALTEVRTVLSRAESALDRLAYLRTRGVIDHEQIQMEFELRETVQSLDRWRRTGRPLKK